MENFQLYRTNVFLGGQMKLDLILDASNNGLSVSDIHLRPISNNMLYSYTENLLNNSHQDNIKSYYNSIKDKFYIESLESEFTHNWPLESLNDNVINYCNTYDMGCRRMKYYHYNKQFEFFCPLWIEQANKSIEFEINISPLNINASFAKKCLKINLKDPKTKFDKYLSEYFKDAKLIEGDQNIMNIDFKSKHANITGLNVASGVFCNNDVSNIIEVLTEIERPLMETDNILIKTFKESSMIAKQLINFNLCFNIEDLIDSEVANLIKGNMFNISVNVYIDGKRLDIKDFYTNYDFIDRAIMNESDTKINVFDYLHDNEYINLIDKNKYAQNICHWSLSEDPTYIFNLYEGFSGINVEKNPNSKNEDDKYIYNVNEHHYGASPNLLATTVTNDNNASKWINTYTVKYWSELNKFITNEDHKNTKYTKLSNEVKFINNVKYNNLNIENDVLYVLSIYTNKLLYETLYSNYAKHGLSIIDIANDVKIYYKEKYCIIITYNNDKLAYSSFENIIDNIKNENYIIKALKSMFDSKVDSSLITIDNSLLWYIDVGPMNSTSEISYTIDNSAKYVLRYDGNIKPAFTDNKNIFYCKDVVDNFYSSVYNTYSKTGYEPLYPSIKYCAITKINDWDYNKKPNNIHSNLEYSWFNNNVCLLISPTLKFTYTSSVADSDKINEKALEIIKTEYNCDDNKAKYIMSKYEKYIYWEYCSENDITNYKYNITLKIK